MRTSVAGDDEVVVKRHDLQMALNCWEPQRFAIPSFDRLSEALEESCK